MKLTKLKKFSALFCGLAAAMAVLLTLSVVGYSIAKTDVAIGWVDGYFKVDRDQWLEWDEKVPEQKVSSEAGYTYLYGKPYEVQDETVEDFLAKFVEHGKKQGEEGFALLRNENNALPLDKSKEVVLYGWNAYYTPNGHTGVVAGNFQGTKMRPQKNGGLKEQTANALYDDITLYSALKGMNGVTVNSTVKAEDFPGVTKKAGYVTTGTDKDGNPTTNPYTIAEEFTEKTSWNIAADSTAIVVVGRGGGEGSNYLADSVTDDVATDALALGKAELEMIKYAKAHSAKVVLLVVSANAMELGPVVTRGGGL